MVLSFIFNLQKIYIKIFCIQTKIIHNSFLFFVQVDFIQALILILRYGKNTSIYAISMHNGACTEDWKIDLKPYLGTHMRGEI